MTLTVNHLLLKSDVSLYMLYIVTITSKFQTGFTSFLWWTWNQSLSQYFGCLWQLTHNTQTGDCIPMLRDEFQLVLYASVVNSTWNPIAVTLELWLKKPNTSMIYMNSVHCWCVWDNTKLVFISRVEEKQLY